MKRLRDLLVALILFSITGYTCWAQTTGDIAFIGFNSDGDNDMAIVTFVDLPANTTIFFTDNELDGTGAFVDVNEGFLEWNTGASVIEAGTVVTFNDVTTTRTASVGTLTNVGVNPFNLDSTGDALFAYLGSTFLMPSTFLAGIQNEANNFGDLTGSGLIENDTFVNFYATGDPNGGAYIGSRTGLGSYELYRAEIADSNNWNIELLNGELVLPFDDTSFIVAPTWSGSTDNDWDNLANWTVPFIPGALDNVIIPAGAPHYPTINDPVTVSSINMASGTTIIANASVTADVTYNRNLATTNWYLVASPVAGETIEDIIANHTLASGTGGNLGWALYSNSGASPWAYQNASSTGAINPGQGYSVKLDSAGDLSFTGSINSSDVNIPIATGTRNNFNLIGNPFTAYVNSALFTSANTLLLSEQTVWLWNGTEYVSYNTLSPIEIAPGQAFFIDAASSGSVSFAVANQSHQGTDTFMKQQPHPSFELFVESESTKKSTRIFYVDNKTTGFDNGYDSKIFSGVNQNFSVFTQLVSNDEGKKLAIQTLPNNNYETMVIPLGLTAEADKEITFSVTSENLPNGIEIYLEDRINNTFVNLSEGNHTIRTTSALNGIGHYYIHTTSAKLSADTIQQNINNISIYQSNEKEITIAGLQEKGTITVYSLLGKEVVNKTINSNGLTTIQLPNIAQGVYVVQLKSVLGTLNKKIIIK